MARMHDSGKRRTFKSGAVRDLAAAKPRIDLISPFAITRLGEWFRLGAEKYAPCNWEKGMSFCEGPYASMCRHVFKWGEGERVPEFEDHLAAVAWNAMALMHYEEMIARNILPASLDDMPDYTPKPKRPRKGKL